MEFPETDIGGVESRARNRDQDRTKACPNCGRVYPTRPGAATSGGPRFGPKSGVSMHFRPEPFAYSAGAPILMAMTVHFPFQNTYAALPANFFARVAPTPVAAPRLIKLNRPLAVHLGLDPDRAVEPRRAPKSSPANACPTGPIRSRWPMPATSSGISCRSSATAGRFCSARSSTPMASAATSSSRARVRRRSRAGATAAPRSGRCCANTSSARRCLRWGFRPRARSRPSSPART